MSTYYSSRRFIDFKNTNDASYIQTDIDFSDGLFFGSVTIHDGINTSHLSFDGDDGEENAGKVIGLIDVLVEEIGKFRSEAGEVLSESGIQFNEEL